MKNRIVKTLTAVAMCAALFVSSAVPVSAANTITFTHGNDNSACKCFAKTSQTTDDATIGAWITWQLNGSNSVVYGPKNTGTGQSVTSYSSSLKGKKGKSYGYYYVNGVKKHESTAWMDFSF